jgi:hypothetical protein
MAAQTSWDPQECGTYHDLLDREERRFDDVFGNMMPDELRGAVVAAAEVWLDDAYEQACMTARREREEESNTSDPGGMPQLFRRPTVPSACSKKVPSVLPRQQAAARKSALKLATAAEPQRKTGGPPLLGKHEHEIRQRVVTNPGANLRIARKTRDEDKGGVRSEVAVQKAGEQLTAETEGCPPDCCEGPGQIPTRWKWKPAMRGRQHRTSLQGEATDSAESWPAR